MSIRDLDERVKDKLRRLAAAHGHSMEAEIRCILTEAVGGPQEADLPSAVFERSRALGGVELDPPPRSTPTRGADLS
jgi:plasmid stability protein